MQTTDQRRYRYLTKKLYQQIPDREVRKRFWIDQPMFVMQVDAMIRKGNAIDNNTILSAMENTYDIMLHDKAFAEESGFWFGTAKNSINRTRRTIQETQTANQT